MGVPAPASWYTRSNTTVPSRSSHPNVSATCEMNGVTMGQWVLTWGMLSSTSRPTAMFFKSSKPVVAVPVRPSASPGEARDAGGAHREQPVAHAQPLEAGEVRDLDGRERLNVDAGVALSQAAEHLQVIRQPQLRVQPAHDVEFASRVVARRIRLGKHLVEAPRVRPRFLRHARERAEDAGVAQHTDVGGVQ